MKREIQFSPLAQQDVEDIGFYIARDDPTAAQDRIERFFTTFEHLAEYPEMGRSRPELSHGIRSFAAAPYVFFYRSKERSIEIIRVLHGARDITSSLFGEENPGAESEYDV